MPQGFSRLCYVSNACTHAISSAGIFLYKYGEQIKGIRIMTWGTTSCGPVDLFTWNSLYPYNYSSNYGGQYQFNVMPSYLTPGQAFGIQNIFNPYYHFAQMMSTVNNSLNPFQNMQQIMLGQAAYANGFNIGTNIGNNVIAQNIGGNIASLKSQLTQALGSEQLTDEQKNKLEVLLNQIEVLENRLKDITVLQQRGANPAAVKAALNEVSASLKVLREKVEQAALSIKNEIENSQEEEIILEDNQNDDGDDNTVQQKQTPLSSEQRKQVRLICDTFADAIDGWGTDDEAFELALSSINSDNVIEVMQHWNKTYKNEFNETFMESFMWDADHGQKRDYGRYILEQLQERADRAGIDIDADAVKIRRELNSWFISNDISAEYDEISNKIISAEAGE